VNGAVLLLASASEAGSWPPEQWWVQPGVYGIAVFGAVVLLYLHFGRGWRWKPGKFRDVLPYKRFRYVHRKNSPSWEEGPGKRFYKVADAGWHNAVVGYNVHSIYGRKDVRHIHVDPDEEVEWVNAPEWWS